MEGSGDDQEKWDRYLPALCQCFRPSASLSDTLNVPTVKFKNGLWHVASLPHGNIIYLTMLNCNTNR